MKLALLATVSLLSAACGPSRAVGVLPTVDAAPPAPDLVVVWVGEARAERLTDGKWVRVPAFDYEFTVENRRWADHWESVKHLRRRHPDYDGSAGPREQTLFFRLDLGAVAGDGRVPLALTTTLGPGAGKADREFRTATLVMHPDVSSFAPFDTYRIEQRYLYEEGRLEETVSLDKGDKPWVRNLERATLFAAHTFPTAPTKR